MTVVMDVAKVTSKGQVTIPADVRDAMGVREGDKVLFVRMDDGSVVIRSSNLDALRRAHEGDDRHQCDAVRHHIPFRQRGKDD